MTKKILSIDDSKMVHMVIARTLKPYNVEVLTALNGQEGVDKAKLETPDLIILDMTMPVMDGYAVLQALQKETRTTRIPFVFLTASSDPLQIRAGLDLGATDYLCKPVPKTKLLTTIQHCLENQNPPGHEP